MIARVRHLLDVRTLLCWARDACEYRVHVIDTQRSCRAYIFFFLLPFFSSRYQGRRGSVRARQSVDALLDSAKREKRFFSANEPFRANNVTF